MQIKTKYKIGDSFFIIGSSTKIQERVVNEISVTVRPIKDVKKPLVDVTYRSSIYGAQNVWVSEQDFHPTKESLIASLK